MDLFRGFVTIQSTTNYNVAINTSIVDRIQGLLWHIWPSLKECMHHIIICSAASHDPCTYELASLLPTDGPISTFRMWWYATALMSHLMPQFTIDATNDIDNKWHINWHLWTNNHKLSNVNTISIIECRVSSFHAPNDCIADVPCIT